MKSLCLQNVPRTPVYLRCTNEELTDNGMVDMGVRLLEGRHVAVPQIT